MEAELILYNMEEVREELSRWDEELVVLKETHAQYLHALEELAWMQRKCETGVRICCQRLADDPSKKARRERAIQEIQRCLPHTPNDHYFRLMLGSVRVTIDPTGYKADYERFKLSLSVVVLGLALCSLLFNDTPAIDLPLLFLLVWYYCTLTVRESVLRANGTDISGWWRAHHFVSTVGAAVLLVAWPKVSYSIRTRLLYYATYTAVIQSLQFWYQRGSLYRLKALGARPDTDVTAEGLRSWMWSLRCVVCLVPALYVGYSQQLLIALELYRVEDAPWTVTMLAGVFLLLGVGNIVATSRVIVSKLREGNGY